MGRFSLLDGNEKSVYDSNNEEEDVDRIDEEEEEEEEEEQEDENPRMMTGYRQNYNPRHNNNNVIINNNQHVMKEDSQEEGSSCSSSLDDNDHYEHTQYQQQYQEEDYEYDQWKRRRQDEAEEYDRFQSRKSTSSSSAWRQQQPQPQQQQLVPLEDRPWSEGEEEQQGTYNNDDDDSMAVVSSEEEENNDSRRLRRRRQRHHDDGHRPIHYHIHLDGREVLADGGAHLVQVLQRLLQRQEQQQQPFMDYPDEDANYTRRLRAINWKSCFHSILALVAVMAHINYWYFNDGASYGGERGNWWWSWKNKMRMSQHVARPASFDFPDLWNLHHDKDDVWRSSYIRLLPIHGQEVALVAVERRLQQWTNAMKATTTMLGGRRQRPLVLYLTGGGTAVGKHSLAYKILQKITRSTTISKKSRQGDGEETALEVCQRQWDGPIVAEENEVAPACPMIRIVDPSVLPTLNQDPNDIEDSTPLLLLLSHVDEWAGSAQVVEDILEHVQYHRPNTVVIMTSNVGATTQDKWMRKQLQQQQQKPEDMSAAQRLPMDGLIPLLEYEVRKFHGADNDHGNTFGWTVIPFVPLDRGSIRSILQDLVVTQAPFDLFVTPAALDRWLDDHLEWLQWIHKTSGISLRQWSPTGARQVQQLWEDRIVTALLEQETKGCVIRGDSSNMHISVLDVDEGLAERFILRSCRSIGSEGRSNSPCDGRTVTSEQESTALCCPYYGTACRFYI